MISQCISFYSGGNDTSTSSEPKSKEEGKKEEKKSWFSKLGKKKSKEGNGKEKSVEKVEETKPQVDTNQSLQFYTIKSAL